MGTFATDQATKYVLPMGGADKNDDGSSSGGIPTLLGGAPPDSFGDDGDIVPAKASNDDVQVAAPPDRQAQPRAGGIGSTGVEPAPDSLEDQTAQRELDKLQPKRGTFPIVEPTPDSAEYQDGMTKAVGHPVVLPDGSRIEDPNSDTGYLMSPVPDLAHVAAAGRRVRGEFEKRAADPETAPEANAYFYTATGVHVGQGGVFDYQRDGNHAAGFTQYPHFRDVSNFNVGLFCQQAGIPLGDALAMAGGLSFVVGRTDRSQPYWLKARTAEFIRKGYAAGESGVFDPPGPP